jgi:hypothetical protein
VVEPMLLKPYYQQVIVPMKKVIVVGVFLVMELFHRYTIALFEEILLDLVKLINEVIQLVVLVV